MTGVLIILGIAMGLAAGGLMLHALTHRFGRTRGRALASHPADHVARMPPPASTPRGSRRVLALVSEPISGDVLRSALGNGADAEVLVVAPALDSRARFWTSDSDGAIGRAEDVQQETVERMTEQGVDAVGDTGESDPLLALQDALATFPADEVVIVTHPGGRRNWAEDDLAEQARARLSMPVRDLEVDAA